MSIETLCAEVRAILPHPLEDGEDLWVIDIGGYGHFLFAGNAEDADWMRAGKAQWEGGIGRLWLASGGAAPSRNEKTADALRVALKYPKGICTWRNYGRSPHTNRTPEAASDE